MAPDEQVRSALSAAVDQYILFGKDAAIDTFRRYTFTNHPLESYLESTIPVITSLDCLERLRTINTIVADILKK